MACICSVSWGYSNRQMYGDGSNNQCKEIGWSSRDDGRSKPFCKTPISWPTSSTKIKKHLLESVALSTCQANFVSECPILKKLPLGFNNAKESKTIIRGEEHWSNELQWEDKVTLNVLLPCFGSIWGHQHGLILCSGEIRIKPMASAFPFIAYLYLTFVFLCG